MAFDLGTSVQGAGMGAQTGFMVGGPWGAVGGAILGGIVGGLAGGKAKKEDNRLKALQAEYFANMLRIVKKVEVMGEDQWKLYNDFFRPVEELLGKQALTGDFAAPENIRQEYMNRASADVMHAFAKQRQITERDLVTSGVDPASGNAIASMRKDAIAAGAEEAGRVNLGARQADEDVFNRRKGVTDLGREVFGAGKQLNEMAYGGWGKAYQTIQGQRAGVAAKLKSDMAVLGGGGMGGMQFPGMGGSGNKAATPSWMPLSGQVGGMAGMTADGGYMADGGGMTASPHADSDTHMGIYGAKYSEGGSVAVPGGSPDSQVSGRTFGGYANGGIEHGDTASGSYMGGNVDGGAVQGPGGPVDDQVPAEVPSGSYVIPADVVEALGVEFFDKIESVNSGQTGTEGMQGRVNAQLSSGEYVVSAPTVQKKGRKFFDDLIEKYHKPAAEQSDQYQAENPGAAPGESAKPFDATQAQGPSAMGDPMAGGAGPGPGNMPQGPSGDPGIAPSADGGPAYDPMGRAQGLDREDVGAAPGTPPGMTGDPVSDQRLKELQAAEAAEQSGGRRMTIDEMLELDEIKSAGKADGGYSASFGNSLGGPHTSLDDGGFFDPASNGPPAMPITTKQPQGDNSYGSADPAYADGGNPLSGGGGEALFTPPTPGPGGGPNVPGMMGSPGFNPSAPSTPGGTQSQQYGYSPPNQAGTENYGYNSKDWRGRFGAANFQWGNTGTTGNVRHGQTQAQAEKQYKDLDPGEYGTFNANAEIMNDPLARWKAERAHYFGGVEHAKDVEAYKGMGVTQRTPVDQGPWPGIPPGGYPDPHNPGMYIMNQGGGEEHYSIGIIGTGDHEGMIGREEEGDIRWYPDPQYGSEDHSAADGGILNSPNAPGYADGKSFDPEGKGYDDETAGKFGIRPDSTGHMPSRAPDGQMLKGRKHKSYHKTEKGEKEAGYHIFEGKGGKHYSQKSEELAMADGGKPRKKTRRGRKKKSYNKEDVKMADGGKMEENARKEMKRTLGAQYTEKEAKAMLKKRKGLKKAVGAQYTEKEADRFLGKFGSSVGK